MIAKRLALAILLVPFLAHADGSGSMTPGLNAPVRQSQLPPKIGPQTTDKSLSVVVASGSAMPVAEADFRKILFYSGVNLEYVCTGAQTLALSSSSWKVQKLFYTGAVLLDVQILTGSCAGRAALAWKTAQGDQMALAQPICGFLISPGVPCLASADTVAYVKTLGVWIPCCTTHAAGYQLSNPTPVPP